MVSYLLNGSKTFITNGWHADLVIVVAKTNPAAGGKGTSLLLGRARHGGVFGRQTAEKAGAEGAGHVRAVLRQRARTGRESAGRRSTWKTKASSA